MFFKERFACYILFCYQCSLLSATAFIYYHLLITLSTTFSTFFRLIFALSKKALKTYLFCWFCCYRVQQPWIIYTLESTKVNTIFYYFFKIALWLILQFSYSFFVQYAHSSFPIYIFHMKNTLSCFFTLFSVRWFSYSILFTMH